MRTRTEHWHISIIEVKAFRSFGPAWCTLDVPDPGLVGVVGPNGSGKSNLLQAVCFATAGSSSLLRLSGRQTLTDVTSTDAGMQRPEVRLTIIQGSTSHLLEACLTPDGTRAYKIDGKAKNGSQVKEFLQTRGIVVDSTTVIQQAAVTQLSDNNNAQALAQLVAGASGLISWDQGTAAARQEITRTYKALKDIHSNITQVQSSVSAADSALKAAAEAAQLERELEQQLQKLILGLQQQQQDLQAQLEARQLAEQQLEGSGVAHAQQLQHFTAQRTALATQKADIMAQLDSRPSLHSSSSAAGSGDGAGSGSGSSSSIGARVAVAEARAAGLQAAIASRADMTAELQHEQLLLQQQKSQCELLQRRLAARQQEAARVSGSLAAIQSSSDDDAAATLQLQQRAQETAVQAAAAADAVQEQAEVLEQQQAESHQADNRLHGLQAQLQNIINSNPPLDHTVTPSAKPTVPATAAEAGCTMAAAAVAAAAASDAADHHSQELAAKQQQVLKAQMQVQASERPLTPAAMSSLLAALGPDCRVAPLHACFKIKDAADAGLAPQQLEQLLVPLSVIAGPAVLQTLVAPSVQEANRVLGLAGGGGPGAAGSSRGGRVSNSNNSRLKIWPLDNLQAHDTQQRQRAAQQQLGSHAVLLPLDLLQFDPVCRPALLRAFGGCMIAADDATAAVLVEQFGLSAVTLQGTVSRKGSMTGGWTGSSGSSTQTYWSNKQQRDVAAAQLASVQTELALAEVRQQQLEQQRATADLHLAAAQGWQRLHQELQQAQAEAATAAAALKQEQQQLQELQCRRDDLQQRLQQYKAALGQDGVLNDRTRQSSKGKKPPAAAVMLRQLQADADEAAAAVAAAEQDLEAAQDKVEELSAGIEAKQHRLGGANEHHHQQEQLQKALQSLQQLRQQHAAQQAATQALQGQLQELQSQLVKVDERLKQAEEKKRDMQQQAGRAAAAVKGAAMALDKSRQELQQLVKQFACTETVQAFESGLLQPAVTESAGSTAAAATVQPAVTEVQLQQLSRSTRQLQAKLSKMDVPELLPGQKELLSARLEQTAEFRRQADALRAAASSLEAQISEDAEQVYAANDIVFEDIAAGFTQLCSSLLPSLEIQLIRTGSQAHEGLQFRFRWLQGGTAGHAADDASQGSSCQWHTSLGQLSGGQRTLVSLAMLLAVARAGGACGLLLLDEVDAALDEVNQARASALLRQLAHDSTSACQIMCVTHNFGFQESCDGFVRITRSPAGHSVPARQSGDAGGGGCGGGGEDGRTGGAATTSSSKPGVKKNKRGAGGTTAKARGGLRTTVAVKSTAAGGRDNDVGRTKKVRFAAK